MQWWRRQTKWFCVIPVVLGMAIRTHGATPYEPRVNEAHFDFVLPRIEDRSPVLLSRYRGQKVLLIHFASW